MKLFKKSISLLLVLCLLLSMSTVVFAASYAGTDVKPGLSGIQPGDSLTLPDNTKWASLTASWGVRVRFIDWDETELQTEVVPVTDTTPGSTMAPADPTRSGYTFTGWERYDTLSGTATLNDDGSVTGVNGPGPIVFIATYVKNVTPPSPPAPVVGNLTVSKTVAGNAADTTKEFRFTVTLDDASVSGAYGEMSFTNGVAVFTLKGGESKTAESLPAGTKYTVFEDDYSGDGYATTISGDIGTIADGKTATAAFTNTKNTIPPMPPADPGIGNLTVSKTISGNAADSAKAFRFTVTLGDTSINGAYGDMSFVNGVATFALKGGESKSALNLPEGTSYTVTEADYSTDGYTVTKTGDTGEIEEGKTAEAAFTNTKNAAPKPKPADPSTPKTGDNTHLILWLMLLAASLIALIVTTIYLKKKKTK